jgi:hypothetical protein
MYKTCVNYGNISIRDRYKSLDFKDSVIFGNECNYTPNTKVKDSVILGNRGNYNPNNRVPEP